MLAVYFQCFENSCLAEREYALRYPDRTHFSRRVFRRLSRRLRETGNVHSMTAPTRQRPSRNEDNIINVLALIEADPQLSTRQVSLQLGLSKTSIHRILKDNRLHPYHLSLHQALSDNDFEQRLNYCHWIRGMCNEDPEYLYRILWTDEATFTNTGEINLHNMHYWSSDNPRWMRQVDHQHRWSINVWCGILGDKIIGPFIFNGHVNGIMYLNFLRDHLPMLLEDVSLEIRRTMWFQHDGCPAHFSREVRDFLETRFPHRWIGRGSLFPWPPRSPDLTVMDFYLWGRLKDIVYQTRPTTPEDMVERIETGIASLPRAEIASAVLSTRRRLNECISNDGKQFEHL